MENIQNSDSVGMALVMLKKNCFFWKYTENIYFYTEKYCAIMHLSGFGTFGI